MRKKNTTYHLACTSPILLSWLPPLTCSNHRSSQISTVNESRVESHDDEENIDEQLADSKEEGDIEGEGDECADHVANLTEVLPELPVFDEVMETSKLDKDFCWTSQARHDQNVRLLDTGCVLEQSEKLTNSWFAKTTNLNHSLHCCWWRKRRKIRLLDCIDAQNHRSRTSLKAAKRIIHANLTTNGCRSRSNNRRFTSALMIVIGRALQSNFHM